MDIHTVYARYGEENPHEKGKSGAEFEIDEISELIEVVEKI